MCLAWSSAAAAHPALNPISSVRASAALEWGAALWARGLIDNQFNYYVRDDGMIKYRATELPQSARMLTVSRIRV